MANYVLWSLIGVVVLLVIYIIVLYNSLAKARNRVKNQWAQIDVQLTRRAELIPNLMECVKGYMSHEKETLERVVEARAAIMRAKDPQRAYEANRQLDAVLPSIFAVAEAYPELKANTNFIQLQSELKNTEDKIAYARQFYNDTVLIYTDRITLFPGNIFASLLGFHKEKCFVADEASVKNVSVKF